MNTTIQENINQYILYIYFLSSYKTELKTQHETETICMNTLKKLMLQILQDVILRHQ